jgi:hypothetical protein
MIGSLQIDASCGFTGEFEALLQECIDNGDAYSDSHYQYQVYRPWGLPCTVLVGHCYQHSSKLQFLDTPSHKLSELIDVAKHIITGEPRQSHVKRVDCTADLPGVPVSMLKKLLRVRFKRSMQEIGYRCQMTNNVETVYYGNKNNCLIVYDKVEETKVRHRKLVRNGRWNDAATFEQHYGFAPDAVRVRVERKYGSSNIPEEFATMEMLIANAMEFNPFESVQICAPLEPLPEPTEAGWDSYIKAAGWKAEVEIYGYAEAYKRLSRFSGNATRFLNHIAKAMPDPEGLPLLSPNLLVETYRKSLAWQLE